MCQMLGYSTEELKNLDTEELVIPEDRELLFENRRRRAAGDVDAMAAVYRLRRKDGTILHLGVDGKLLVIDGREVILGIGQDVTESARARELLREAESHYRALVEQSLVGIYIMAKDRMVYANPMLCDLLGYTCAELVGMHAKEIIIPEDHAVIGARLQRRHLGETGSISTQCRARCRDGRIVHLSIESNVIELGGRKAAVGVVQDITERESAAHALRESEEKYRLLWETTRDANQRLRVLSKRVLDIQEQERRAISMELHDDIGQSLLALTMGLHRIKARTRDEGADVIDNCIRVSEAMQEKLREMSVQLHPPQLEQLGLPDALRWLVNRQKSLTGLSISCRFGFSGRLAIEVESACYRICQEALNNATRHSGAKMIVVELDDDAESLILTVRDDGVGFDEARKREEALLRGSLGLISMEERARLAGGRLRMRTAPGHGTSVCAYFPRGPETRADAVAASGAA
jgi:PAS domain S-box-containing protein